MARLALLCLATAVVGTAALLHATCEPTPAPAPAPAPAPEVTRAGEPAVLAYEVKPERAASPGVAFAFVVELDGPHLVLATSVSDDWVRGDLDLEAPDTASVDLDPLGVPLQLLAWDEVTLYGFDGNPIDTGRIGTPRAISQAVVFEDDALAAAERIWEHGARMIVAPIDAESDGEAVFALPSSHPRPPVRPLDDTIRATIGSDRPALVTDLNADGYLDVLLTPGEDEGTHTLLLGTSVGFRETAVLPEVPTLECAARFAGPRWG